MESGEKPIAPPSYYANMVHVTSSPYDVTLDFSFRPSAYHSRGDETPDVRVTMSSSHAKSLLEVLADRIAHYEEHYGVIPSPHRSDGMGD